MERDWNVEKAGPDRRGFLKAAGFSFGILGLAGCRTAPVERAMGFVEHPPGVTPGKSYYYATTCTACTAGCGVLAEVRDGRPIKLEGNPGHPVSRGGLCAVGQASILGLYDSLRLKQPHIGGQAAGWERVDAELGARLEAIRKSGGAVRFLSRTVTSPTLRAAIARFLDGFADGRQVIYDPLSCSAIADAHGRTHGVRAIPRYRFERAAVIASFDADFLGTWISPVEFTAGYSRARLPESGHPAWHAQFEGRMSLTGTKADLRVPTSYGELEARMREAAAGEGETGRRLRAARGRGLVVCGAQDVELQMLANRMNQELGNYGNTLDIERPSFQKQGRDADLERLMGELEAGKVAALFVYGVNPAYDFPSAPLAKAGMLVSFAERLDETARLAHYCCPDHHVLESWADSEPVAGVVSLVQPVIRPLGATRAAMESLALWSGTPRTVQEALRERYGQTQEAWEQALAAGYIERETPVGRAAYREPAQSQSLPGDGGPLEEEGLELALYAKPAMLEGSPAYNPWLHELPDPVTKVSWDNYACLAPATAAKLGVADGDVVRVACGNEAIELPAVVQPGQHERVVAVALGYGSRLSSRFAGVGPRWIGSRATVGENGLVGRNAAPLLRLEGGALRYTRGGATLARTARQMELACTQDHHRLTVPEKLGAHPPRPIVQETGTPVPEHHAPERDLWPDDHPKRGHYWGMAIDLNACTGCSACVVACQVENNIPVVGKDEVRRKRAMHWIRIDRYYAGPQENPRVAHQPMMCQQCGNAPCETVCPVLATVHSSEGLNQQVYNRCVGTRYCANNCPYKARRFNWFEYAREDRLANMVLNPDVTVRSRGVMEKCTFCVQRIQEARIEARRKGVPLADGDIQPACQQSCPAGAIVFGDLNDPESRVSRLVRGGRAYRVLEELNVRPAIAYLKIARGGEDQRHG